VSGRRAREGYPITKAPAAFPLRGLRLIAVAGARALRQDLYWKGRRRWCERVEGVRPLQRNRRSAAPLAGPAGAASPEGAARAWTGHLPAPHQPRSPLRVPKMSSSAKLFRAAPVAVCQSIGTDGVGWGRIGIDATRRPDPPWLAPFRAGQSATHWNHDQLAGQGRARAGGGGAGRGVSFFRHARSLTSLCEVPGVRSRLV
jgi:hypothetical protein